MTDRPTQQRTSIAGRSAILVALLASFAWVLAAVGAAVAAGTDATSTAVPASIGVWSVPSSTYPQQSFRLGATAPLRSGVTVTESGRPVKDASINPLTGAGAVLMIDRSWSMNGASDNAAVEAARAFVAERNPAEPVGIIYFAQTPIVAAPLTTNTHVLDQALATPPQHQSGTLIMDSAAKALAMLTAAHVSNGSILLVSDGQDTGSKTSESTLASELQASGVHLFTFGMQDPSFDGSTLSSMATEASGTYVPTSPATVVATYRTLGAQLAHQYSLSYRSPTAVGSTAVVAVSAPGFPTASTSYATGSSLSAPQSKSFFDSTAAVILISLIVAILIGVAVFALTRRRNEVSTRVGEFVLPVTGGGQNRERSLVELALGDAQSRQMNRSPRWQTLATELDVAGIKIAPVNYVVISIIVTLVVAWFLATLLGSILGALIAIIVPFAALFLARTMADRQRRLFDSQLPDNLSVVASAMRAGQTFLGALQAVVDTAPEPSKSELRRAVTDAQLGVPIEESLGALGERLQSSDFKHVALVAQLQRETGGNTAEVVELVADTIRERLELRQMVRALTAQGRLAGVLLSGLPVGLLLMVSLINPTYVHPLFHTTIGIILLVAAGVLTVSGSFVIKKIVTIEL